MCMIFNLKIFKAQYLEQPSHFRMTSVVPLPTIIQPEVRGQPGSARCLSSCTSLSRAPTVSAVVFQCLHYQWRALLFGICTALWLFTRIAKPIVQFLHHRGIIFEAFLDDCIQEHADQAPLVKHLNFTQKLLQKGGWLIKVSKPETTPTQHLQFIGALFQFLPNLGKMFVSQTGGFKSRLSAKESLCSHSH